MDYSSDSCQQEFLRIRKNFQKLARITSSTEREESLINAYNDICLRASKDDCIAQDYLAYIFKKGLEQIVPINYERFMQWQILSGANGNQFAIDKLFLFLKFSFDEIMSVDDFDYIIRRNCLNNNNYSYIVGRLICEGIVDDLLIDAKKLLSEPLTYNEYNPVSMRVFDRSRNFVIPKVLKFLRN